MIPSVDDSLALARKLCLAAGTSEARSIEKLVGGKNNRVFRVVTVNDSPLVMKLYHVDARDTRDRLAHEWAFLSYVWRRGVHNVPEPLAFLPESAVALYSHIPGRKVDQAELDKPMIDQASDFIIAVNSAPRETASLPPGSESCFSIADHLATVERRVARFGALDDDVPLRLEAEALISSKLLPGWERVKAELVSAYGDTIADPLPQSEHCISPSDFGFHNALVAQDATASFIDFEYAGRDDPAKLVCDFFCCPEIQVQIKFRKAFIERIGKGLSLGSGFHERCDRLLDAYRVKWTCIILNDFLPLGSARRDFATGGERAGRCAVQLEKAASKLAEISLK